MSNSEAAVTKGKEKKKGGKAAVKKEVNGGDAEHNKQKEKNPLKKEESSNDKPAGTKRKRGNTAGNKNATPRKRAKNEKSKNKMSSKLKEKKNILKHKVSNVKSIKKKTKAQEKNVKKRNPTHLKKEENVDAQSENVKEKGIKSETLTDESSGKAEEKVAVTKTNPQKKKKGVKSEPVPRPLKYESLGEGPSSVPSTGKMYVGCHVSGAAGVWNAFGNADECKAKSFGVFLRNQRQWVAKPLDEGTVEKWQKAMKDMPPHLILPHGSYLMNLGSPDPVTIEKSRGMMLEEIQRCEKLGIPHYNFHPGSTVGKISREECCKTIAESINLVSEQTKGVIFVLENMSYQGFTVGGDFHELRTIIEHVNDRTRVGVCLDTCHAHAAGYDLGTEAGFQSMIDDFGKIIGWQFLRGLHVNDSKGQAGDHLDRHETIGEGTIGIEGFRRIMNCQYFKDIPLILETPWTSNAGYAKEIEILENLIAK